MHNLILIGLPASGKTSAGRALARRLDIPFYDCDEAIEAAQGQSISAIFSQRGEAFFRDAESRMLEELCRREDIDVLFIGPMDISQSLGHPGDPAHPEVQQVVRQVIDTCNANEKPFGIFVGTTEAARKYRDLGASYIAIASDLAFMAKGYHQMVDELKK